MRLPLNQLIVSACVTACVIVSPSSVAGQTAFGPEVITFGEPAFPDATTDAGIVVQGPDGSTTESYNVLDDATGAILAEENGDQDDFTFTYSTSATGELGQANRPDIRFRVSGALGSQITGRTGFDGDPTANNPGTRQSYTVEVRFAEHLDIETLALNLNSLNTAGIGWELSLISFLDENGELFSPLPEIPAYLEAGDGLDGNVAPGHWVMALTSTVEDVDTDQTSDGVSNPPADGPSILTEQNLGVEGERLGGFVLTTMLEDVRGVSNGPTGFTSSLRQFILSGTITEAEVSAPTITDVSPSEGVEGDVVTITGTELDDDAVVGICEQDVTPDSVTAAAIDFTAPPCDAAGPQDVTVTNPDGGSATAPDAFTYIPPGVTPPTLTEVEPAEGDAGDTATVVGEDLQEGAAVRLCGEDVVPFSSSDTALAFIVPPCLEGGAQSVSVINPDGGSDTLAEAFTYGWNFRYDFAEGATGFFTTGLGLFNPDAEEMVSAEVTLLTDIGPPVVVEIALEPLSRESVDVNAAVGVPAGVAAIIKSDRPIAPMRQLHWDASVFGSTLESGALGPSTVHYFGEGATVIWDLFHLLSNDTETAAEVTIQYLRHEGPPVEHQVTVPAASRRTIWANAVPGMESTLAGAIITSNVPIAAERAMYLQAGGQAWPAGASSRGAHQLDTTWFFAEGATTFFDTFLLFMNTDPDTAAEVEVVYHLPDGQTISKDHVVPANQRFTILVSAEDPALASTAVAMSVTSTLPIMAERAMWWGPTAASWYESHATLGSTETGTTWGVGEAWSGGPGDEDAFVLVSNAADADGQIQVTLVYDDGTHEVQEHALAANARLTLLLSAQFPDSEGRRFSVLIESLGDEDAAPIMVEVSRYQSTGGVFGNAGGATTATKIQ